MSAEARHRTNLAPETTIRDDGTELRESYAEVGDVTLHYVEAGDGPLIVLLHGFPEFWFGWRLQIARWRRRAFASSRPTCAATTCHRNRKASRPTAPTGSPATSAASFENSVPIPPCWSATTGVAPPPGRPR